MGITHPSLFFFPLQVKPNLLILDVENSLAKVLALEDTKKTLGGVVDALGDVELDLDGALGNPLGELLLVLLAVLGAKVLVENDEAAHLEALGEDVDEVLDAVALFGLGVVLGDLSWFTVSKMKCDLERRKLTMPQATMRPHRLRVSRAASRCSPPTFS